MRSYQVFATMLPERAREVLKAISEVAPAAFAQAVAVASAAMRARPIFLMRQPFEKRADAVRRTLARVAASELAEELLAVYFLQCRKPLLLEWLDLVGLEHEEGALKSEAPPSPAADVLGKAVHTYRKPEDAADRELLLQAFAAQTAIDWPDLEKLLAQS
ncbi:MAG TPA: hypothetical protein VK714_05620 [Myxococcota bacterium]|nr:hypothetical protein [Myxococcota bacterium]